MPTPSDTLRDWGEALRRALRDLARDYGIVQLSVNGRPLQPLVDGSHDGVVPTGPISFGALPMRAGTNEGTVALLGKGERTAGYSDGSLVGIDGFLLRESR